MRPIAYERAATPEAAVRAASARNGAESADFIAGGTTLLDLMKLDVERPARLIDINPLARNGLAAVETGGEGLRLGALARMSAVAENAEVRRRWPLVAQSLALAASPQLRNMATLGGNVLQRTRCPYFRDTSYEACNKRAPGSGCSALDGFNRLHAVLGTSDGCIASYPGDFAQALVALDARVRLIGAGGERRIPFADLHRGPEEPARETNLRAGEMIAGFEIPAGDFRRSMYLKVRDRQSYAFALASAAVALRMSGDRIDEARIALGGIAYRPWRAREAEALLRGQTLSEDRVRRAAAAAFAGAKTQEHNAFKVKLGQETLVRAVLETARMEV